MAKKKEMDYKAAYAEALMINTLLQAQLESANERAEEWFQDADKAHKLQEELVKTVSKLTLETTMQFTKIEEKTGEITFVDVAYHMSYIERVILHMYSPKEEKEEE